MFKTFFTRELKTGFKQSLVYVLMLLFGLLVTLALISDSVVIGGSVGNVNRNSPYTLTIYVAVLSIFGLLMAAAFFNNAALRDYRFQFNEILFSTPLKKSGYFFGRFFGALILSTVPFLGIYLAFLIAPLIGPMGDWMPADRFGPTPWMGFVNTYLIFVLPNMFIAGTLIFALAIRFKNTIISFVGALVILVGYIIAGGLLSDIENETLAAIVDVFGINTYSVVTKYHTTIEQNTLYPTFSGLLLINRLIWIAIAVVVALISYFTFSFKQRQKGKKASGKKEAPQQLAPATLTAPAITPSFSGGTTWKQFTSFFKINLLSILKSNLFIILLLFNTILLITGLWGGFEYFGLKSYPVTYKMIGAISGNTDIFLLIIMVFFSGELVWRDRDNNINEVIDATPHFSITSLFAKGLSLVVMLVLLYTSAVVIAVLYQLLSGYSNIELGVYFSHFFLNNFPSYIAWSFILIFLQVLLNQKYLAYFISVLLLFALPILMNVLDIQSNMVAIGGTPSVRYSDMSGFGPGVTGALWFNAYWILFGAVVLFLAGFFWVRGKDNIVSNRLMKFRNRFKGRTAVGFALCAVLFIAVGGWVYYNTQILNTYRTSKENEKASVDYEKKYSKFKDRPLLSIIEAKYNIDLFPYKRDVFAKTDLKLTNKTDQLMDSLFFTVNDDWNPKIKLDGAKEVFYDEDIGFQIFALSMSIQPGDTVDMTIETSYITEGFENSAGNTSIVSNGTFLNNATILPTFGYSERFELSDKNTRKKYDLKPKDRVPKLTTDCGHLCTINYLTNGVADWVNVETIISTASDQIAVAPGSLLKEWEENGRRYFHYKVDHPSQNFYSFISARFEVARKEWNGVDIEIYHHPEHDYNIDMMIEAVEKSLTYYTKEFGPYYHNQARIIEFPRYANFAQAFPGTMPYSESFGFIINLEDETDNNVIDAVIAHEMAHQWWAHQEIPATMQGMTMLTESFSEYSSLMVMKSTADDMKMKNFLKYDFDRYLGGRQGETEKELPLYKVENQSYIHYGKGAVILYALQDYIGEDSVNMALREFLEAYRYKDPPYPTSYDFLSFLEPKVPDSLSYLIDDFFKEITLYDFRLKEATYQPVAEGRYKVRMEIESRKLKSDSIGREREVPINEWVDVGVYKDTDEEELLFHKRVKLDQPKQTIEFEVAGVPVKAGIDPRRLLIERITDDNVQRVESMDE